MIIERLSQEHRNIEKLLAILERELEVFDRGDRPDYKVIRPVISYLPGGLPPSPGGLGLCQAKNSRSGCGCEGR
jgi:hypothetical protein